MKFLLSAIDHIKTEIDKQSETINETIDKLYERLDLATQPYEQYLICDEIATLNKLWSSILDLKKILG